MALFFSNFISRPSNTIFRKTDLKFDARLKWLVDVDFYIRYLTNYKNVVHLDEELVLVIGNANHNITKTRQFNPEVEAFEYTYLYNKNKKNLRPAIC